MSSVDIPLILSSYTILQACKEFEFSCASYAYWLLIFTYTWQVICILQHIHTHIHTYIIDKLQQTADNDPQFVQPSRFLYKFN